MKIVSHLLSTFIFFFLISGLEAQSPRTFYVGHSLSDQIPDMVQSLSNDHQDVDFSWVYQSIPGAPLRWQWDRKDLNDCYIIEPNYYCFFHPEFGLPSGDFDALVLTESVPRYMDIINETYSYADSFYHYAIAHNPNTKVYLYEDWHCLLSGTPTQCDYDIDSNPWRQRLEDDLSMWESVVDTLNARYNPDSPVCLIPVGQGLAALYDSIEAGVIPDVMEIEDIFSDNIHLNDVGKYYAACIHFAMIHETSPVGLTNQLQVWWGGDFDAPSPELALKFQEMAWETVNRYPNTCLSVQTDLDNTVVNYDVKLIPNPTSDIFEIRGLIGDNVIEIVDVSGKTYQRLETTKDRIEINIQSLPGGLYFAKIVDTESGLVQVEKILKQN